MNTIITASEVGEFVYCKRAWWLRTKKLLKENAQMVEGTAKHDALFNKLSLQKRLKLIVVGIIFIGIVILGIGIFFYMYG